MCILIISKHILWVISYENVKFVYPTWGNVASNRNIEINTPTNVIHM